MPRLVLSRLAAAVPTLFAVIALSFFLMRLAPGGPFDAERALDPAVAANLRHIYRLDLALPQQFWLYLVSLAHGDLGPSFHWRDFTVNELFARALPISLRLGSEALVVAVLAGGALGIAAGVGRTRAATRGIAALSFVGLAVPSFVVAPLLQLAFGLALGWLPVGGWNDGSFRAQILPVVTLALPQLAIIAGLTRGGLREALGAPHIRTLRSLGLPAWHVTAHALRGALLPIVSYLGPAAAGLLTGSIVVETIFGIPGIGRYFVDGALSRDYTLVMATVIVIAALTILFNLLADIAYGLLDPRVRHP